MENASEALMMAFGILIFVLALTVAINSFNRVKAVSDIVLYSGDETNYYEYQGATGKASQNRVVGLETIIPTLYKYYKENYTVLFRQGSYNSQTGEFSNLTPLIIYKTSSTYRTNKGAYLWGRIDTKNNQSSYDTLLQNKYSTYFTNPYNKKGSSEIFSFDLEEETLRHEPWTGTYNKAKSNLDSFLNGQIYYNPSNNNKYIDYSQVPLGIGGFNKKYEKRKFVETIGEYSTSSDAEDEFGDEIGSTNSSLKEKKKRIEIFTLINNLENTDEEENP